MATLGALRHPWNRLLRPYRTHVLCPPNLCPKAEIAGLLSPQSGCCKFGRRWGLQPNLKRIALVRSLTFAQIRGAPEHCWPFKIAPDRGRGFDKGAIRGAKSVSELQKWPSGASDFNKLRNPSLLSRQRSRVRAPSSPP